jgi:hypothetical protein
MVFQEKFCRLRAAVIDPKQTLKLLANIKILDTEGVKLTYFANVYNVLIASPSDVAEERKLIVDVLQEWNALHSISRQVILMPCMWEIHAAPESWVRPQEVINNEVVDNCDIGIGVFWSKPGITTELAESGTIEEIERMASSGKLVMLYFSKKDLPYDHDSEAVNKVKEFKKRMMNNCLIGEYSNLNDLKKILINHITIKSRVFQSVSEKVNEKTLIKTTTRIQGEEIHRLVFKDGSNKEGLLSHECEMTILEYLFNHNDGSECPVTFMSNSFKIQEQAVLSYLERLMDKEYVEHYGSYESGTYHYCLSKSGRAFFIESGFSKQ